MLLLEGHVSIKEEKSWVPIGIQLLYYKVATVLNCKPNNPKLESLT